MLKPTFVVGIFLVGAMVLVAGAVSGQTYPNKLIRIVTGSATGISGVASRLMAPAISASLGQPITIDNRGGGSTSIEVAAKAPPDGYTLLLTGTGFWVEPLLHKVTFDPATDFAPVSWVGTTPNVLVVHPSLPVKSVKELIALAKARPGELNYSMGGLGGPNHLAGELFKSMAGINIVNVSYKSLSQIIADLISGRVPMTFNTPPALMEHVKSGKLRALAVTTAEPSPLVPGVPTVAATLPGYEMAQNLVMYVPAKTPEAIINRLNQEVVRFLKTPEAKQQFLNVGIVPVGSSPEQLAAAMKSEIARLAKVIKAAGIKIE